MTNTITINPTFIGTLALDAARHVWQRDNGPREKAQYEHLLALLGVCSLDYIATSECELGTMLHKVLDIFDETDDLAAVGEYVAEWINSWTLKEQA